MQAAISLLENFRGELWLKENKYIDEVRQLQELFEGILSQPVVFQNIKPNMNEEAVLSIGQYFNHPSNEISFISDSSIENLPSLKIFSLVEMISIVNCPLLKDIDAIKDCTSLKKLSIRSCPQVSYLHVLTQLPQIEDLILHGFDNNMRLEPIGNLRSLKSLKLQAPHIPSVPLDILEDLLNLERLALDNIKINNISILNNNKNLKSLTLHTCTFKKSDALSELTELKNLEELYLDDCNDLTLLNLSLFPKLKTLSIANCNNLQNLSQLANYPHIAIRYSIHSC